MAMAIVFRSCCNGDGATATGRRRRSIAIAMALGQWQWGDGALAAMGMFYFVDQCHVLWLLKTCKTCGRPLFVKLFLQLKQAPFDLKF
jgi:hypothetical protein